MSIYYNENDPYAAEWLKNLISAGLIPYGDVDDRDIQEVTVHEIENYQQCHFFAGIGGWALAIELSKWGSERVWTGSCPCQPFSVAGRRNGTSDPRHLWPAWHRLISSAKPATIFGEQVKGALTGGWYDNVANDLEKQGYETAAAVLPAISVGAPHQRDRLFFVADTNSHGRKTRQKIEIRERQQSFKRSCFPERAREPWAIEPRVGRMVNGIRHRMAKLRALGNAIVPQVAAEFINAYLKTL